MVGKKVKEIILTDPLRPESPHTCCKTSTGHESGEISALKSCQKPGHKYIRTQWHHDQVLLSPLLFVCNADFSAIV